MIRPRTELSNDVAESEVASMTAGSIDFSWVGWVERREARGKDKRQLLRARMKKEVTDERCG